MKSGMASDATPIFAGRGQPLGKRVGVRGPLESFFNAVLDLVRREMPRHPIRPHGYPIPIRRYADRPPRFPWHLLLVTIFGFVQPSPGLAQNFYDNWNIPNATNGLWITPTSWSTGGVPNSTTVYAFIGNNANVTLNGSNNITVNQFQEGDSFITAGQPLTSDTLTVSGGATLTMTNTLNAPSYLGVTRVARNTGVLIVTGTGTAVTSAETFNVGWGGIGIITVASNALMTVGGDLTLGSPYANTASVITAGTGAVTVDGAGQSTPTKLTVSGTTYIGNGTATTGTLTVLNGGVFTSSNSIRCT